MHIYQCVPSHIVIPQQNISVTAVPNITVSCNINAISLQIIVKKCMIKPLGASMYIYRAFHNILRDYKHL
jgi:hypothetical protein